MSWSATEIMALVAKAARGAGAPPAQAAQFGRAAVVHRAGGGAPEDLILALEALPDGPIMDLPLALLRVAEAAELEGDIAAAGHMPLAKSYVEAMPCVTKTSTSGDTIHLSITPDQPANHAPMRRLDVPDAVIAALNALAARILVPESDASRLSGAGAGLSDND